MANQGTVYFLRNPAMPGLVKVGHTTGCIEDRLRQLSTTGVPQPFQAIAIFRVSDSEACERAVHEALADFRLAKNREFFEGSLCELLLAAVPIVSNFQLALELASERLAPSVATDDDDVYFLFFLLHDGYETGQFMSTEDLVEHHQDYAPLELEYKLLKLADKGLVERKAGYRSGLSTWKLSPKGLQFMFEGGHVAKDLLAEARPSHRQRSG